MDAFIRRMVEAGAEHGERFTADDVRAALEQFELAPVDWESDPAARLFANATGEANGRRISASLVAAYRDALVVTVSVTRIEGAPLDDDVLLLLHPTFPERIQRLPVMDGVAETSFFASRAFTLVAIADGGRTVLAYQLATLPGAPEWFVRQ